MNTFQLATELARAEGATNLKQIATKHVALRAIKNRSTAVCCCSSYDFPHRAGGGDCCAPKDFDNTNPPRYCSECQYQKTERDPYGLGSIFADERYRTHTYCSMESGCPWGENWPC